MNIEQLHSHTSGVTIYKRVEALVVQASTDGVLTLEEETAIVTAITRSGKPTAAVCRLYRLMQERVWDGELLLDRSRNG